MQKKENAMQIMEATSREVHGIEFLAGLDQQLKVSQKYLETRLRSIPGGWQKYRTAQKFIEMVLDAVYQTLPDRTMRHMVNLCSCGEVVIRPKPMVKYDEVQIVTTTNLRMLINVSIAAKCAFCMNRDGDVRSCEMRRALMTIAPPVEMPPDSSCPYQNVAHDNALGDYI